MGHNRSIKGFTLFEIVIALGVLALGILGVLSLFPVGLDSQKRSVDYSNAMSLAQWKLGDIFMDAHTTPLSAPNEFPNSSPDPEPFTDNPKYMWHYYVTQPGAANAPSLFRIDLFIYSIGDYNETTSKYEPIDQLVTFYENP